nr:hypothetical protein Itr_chr07CG07250 [Ipomoea trifida]GLL31267.1 hypothetical protein Itr_chr07CG07260 [Ipomoea trifida]GLL31268.1 hypothetical protein Itr_chr07CG07270 [Ipomoea trifida]
MIMVGGGNGVFPLPAFLSSAANVGSNVHFSPVPAEECGGPPLTAQGDRVVENSRKIAMAVRRSPRHERSRETQPQPFSPSSPLLDETDWFEGSGAVAGGKTASSSPLG